MATRRDQILHGKLGLPCHHCGAHFTEVNDKCVKKCSLIMRMDWDVLIREHNRMVKHCTRNKRFGH